MTIVTTVLLGLVYPLVVTALAQLFFRDKANGQLVERNGTVVASRIIAQPFVGAGYFHPRPSAAGNGYDATSSGGIELGAHQSETHRSRERRRGHRSGGESRQARPGRHGHDFRFRT